MSSYSRARSLLERGREGETTSAIQLKCHLLPLALAKRDPFECACLKGTLFGVVYNVKTSGVGGFNAQTRVCVCVCAFVYVHRNSQSLLRPYQGL